ncbi:MAG: hypothetical protein WC375_00025 [Methanomassiliicoccales archaeon]
MTRYEKIAKRAILQHLASKQEPVTLWSVSCIADSAVRNVGKKRELYKSLYDYQSLLPNQWTSKWLTAQGGTGDSMLMVTPPNWNEGKSQSNQLLLGQGTLIAYNNIGME